MEADHAGRPARPIHKIARFRKAGGSAKPRGLPLPQLSFQVAN